ncbi:Uncharacterised protein [Bacteroides xylanisolvens]|nr:Uncharacterised protein [Bacteroides xylanisolvens]
MDEGNRPSYIRCRKAARKKPWFFPFLFREPLPVEGLPAARLCRVKKMSADAGILFFLRFVIIRTDDGEPSHGKYLCFKHAVHLHIVEACLLDLLSLCRRGRHHDRHLFNARICRTHDGLCRLKRNAAFTLLEEKHHPHI